MSILKKHITKILFILVAIILAIVIYYEYHNPNIYHAKYLDKLYDKEQNIFIIKNTFMDIASCQGIEKWAIKNLSTQSSDTVTFITHSSDIDEDYTFLKTDFEKTIWSNLVCEMDAKNKECYYCRK